MDTSQTRVLSSKDSVSLDCQHHGLRTPNGSGSEISAVQWRLFPLWASVVRGQHSRSLGSICQEVTKVTTHTYLIHTWLQWMTRYWFWYSEPRTTDAQRGNSHHCTVENSLPLPMPHQPNFSDIFDFSLHLVSVVGDCCPWTLVFFHLLLTKCLYVHYLPIQFWGNSFANMKTSAQVTL